MSHTTGLQPGLVASHGDTAATAPSTRTAHRADIDGLRAIAVAIVVAFHCGLPWVSGGFVGVDVFFVISGYLIGGIIYEDAVKQRFSYANFYARRIRRIAPALIVVMVATTLFALLFLSPLELKSFSLFAIGTALSVPNIVFLQTMNYFAGNSDLNPLLMTWSLGVEEQFYIIFPMVLIGLMRWRWKLVPSLLAIAILSFAMNLWLTAKHPPIAFFALPPRAWELGAGVLLAIWQSTRSGSTFALPPKWGRAMREIAPTCGLGMILIAVGCFDSRMQFPGWAALLPVAGTVLIIANQGSMNRVLLGSRPLVFVGLLSYSWYLWHWPLLSFSRIASDMPLTWQQATTVSAVSFGISYLSYRYIETPFRTGWRGSPYSMWIGGYLIAILALTLLLLGIYRTDGVPSRVTDRIGATERQAVSDRSNACLSGYGSVKMNLSPDCVVPTGSNTASVALLGDSHASALRSGMDDYARRHGVGLVQLTKSSCPMLIGVSRVMKDHPRHFQECAQFNQAVLDYVSRSPEIKTVVLAGYWSAAIKEMTADQGYQSTTESLAFTRDNSLQLLKVGLSNAVESLRRSGKRVVVMDDVPLLKFNPVKHVASASIAPRRMVAEGLFGNLAPDDERTHLVEGIDEGVEDAVAAAATAPTTAAIGSVDLYSLRDQFCGATGCRFAQGSRTFYVDQQHLSGDGARYSLAAMR